MRFLAGQGHKKNGPQVADQLHLGAGASRDRMSS